MYSLFVVEDLVQISLGGQGGLGAHLWNLGVGRFARV